MCRVGRSIPPHRKGESVAGWGGKRPPQARRDSQLPGPCRRSGGAGVGAGDPRTARQARAEGGSLGGRRRAGRVSLLPPAGAGLSGVGFARLVLPVRAAPCEMVPLPGVAVTAPGKAPSAKRSALPLPAGGSRAGRAMCAGGVPPLRS